jgi:hypothetical protein
MILENKIALLLRYWTKGNTIESSGLSEFMGEKNVLTLEISNPNIIIVTTIAIKIEPP